MSRGWIRRHEDLLANSLIIFPLVLESTITLAWITWVLYKKWDRRRNIYYSLGIVETSLKERIRNWFRSRQKEYWGKMILWLTGLGVCLWIFILTDSFPLIAAIKHLFHVLTENPHRWPPWIPRQTRANVFTGYIFIAIFSWELAIFRIALKKRFVTGISNILAGCISIITIIVMFNGIYETRWHHMSFGILFTLTGLRGFSVLGWSLVFDSMGYWLPKYQSGRFTFGMDDVLSDNFKTIMISLVICAVWEIVLRKLVKLRKPARSTPGYMDEMDEMDEMYSIDFV